MDDPSANVMTVPLELPPAVAFSICFQEQNKIQGDKPNKQA